MGSMLNSKECSCINKIDQNEYSENMKQEELKQRRNTITSSEVHYDSVTLSIAKPNVEYLEKQNEIAQQQHTYESENHDDSTRYSIANKRLTIISNPIEKNRISKIPDNQPRESFLPIFDSIAVPVVCPVYLEDDFENPKVAKPIDMNPFGVPITEDKPLPSKVAEIEYDLGDSIDPAKIKALRLVEKTSVGRISKTTDAHK